MKKLIALLLSVLLALTSMAPAYAAKPYLENQNFSIEASIDELADGIIAGQNDQIDEVIKMLNHLIVVDTLWLKRFAIHPANYTALESVLSLPTPENLEQIVSTNIQELAEFRQYLDKIICEWAHAISRIDLDHQL